MISEALKRYFPRLTIPRKRHRCRLCEQWIEVKEPCCSWTCLEDGEGWETFYAHPECFQVTIDDKWDDGDWECCHGGEFDRPQNGFAYTFEALIKLGEKDGGL